MIPKAAFVVHPLAAWQRPLFGVRWADPRMLGPSAPERTGPIATLHLQTLAGPVDLDVLGVPDLPARLTGDQARALRLQVLAADLAIDRGAQVVGLGSALAVVAGRGEALAAETGARVTTGHAATAWACAEIVGLASGTEDVGILGFRGTVGDAVAQLLAGGRRVLVEATGRADERRAREIGVTPAPRADILQTCRIVVGAITTGPGLEPGQVLPGTTVIDLAVPPLLRPGPLPPGVVVLAGETVAWPGRVSSGPWGALWRGFAGYEGRSAYACLAEPVAAAVTGEGPWSEGRRLSLDQLRRAGRALRRVGFSPTLLARRR